MVGKPVCNFATVAEVNEEEEKSQPSSVTTVSSDTTSIPAVDVLCHASKTTVVQAEEQFYRAEAMGTTVNPECGSCKCGKCPIPGSKYCLKEQQDRDEFNRNLKYIAAEWRYYTVYPWLYVRSTLPKNDRIAYQCLLSLERKLSQDPELAKEFCSQVEDMLKRKVAVVLTDEEVASWTGD